MDGIAWDQTPTQQADETLVTTVSLSRWNRMGSDAHATVKSLKVENAKKKIGGSFYPHKNEIVMGMKPGTVTENIDDHMVHEIGHSMWASGRTEKQRAEWIERMKPSLQRGHSISPYIAQYRDRWTAGENPNLLYNECHSEVTSYMKSKNDKKNWGSIVYEGEKKEMTEEMISHMEEAVKIYKEVFGDS